MILRILPFICVSLLLWGLPRQVQAATTCTTSATDVTVTGYDGSATATANATVTISCSSRFAFGGDVHIDMCLYIGNTPRTLTNGGNSLNYELKTAGSTWQDYSASIPSEPQRVRFSYGTNWLGRGSATRTVSVTAEIPAQVVPSTGTYAQRLNETRAEYQYAEPDIFFGVTPPTNCRTGGDGGSNYLTFPFTARATIAPSCRINSTTNLDFGTVGGLISTPLEQTSQINLTCVGGTPWQAGLNDGLHVAGGARRMANGAGEFVSYELFRDAARMQRWGNTLNTDTRSGSGTGNSQALTVYGRVPAQSATPGNYSDTITVTVTY